MSKDSLYILTYIPMTYTICLYKCNYFDNPKALLYSFDSAKWVPITPKDLKDFLNIETIVIQNNDIALITESLTEKFKDNKHYTSILTFLRGE
jgi:hypothetical protein